MRQIEAILHWNLLPIFERLQISNRLILDQVASPSDDLCAIAYVGVEDKPNPFYTATSYLDLFVLVCALTSDISVTYRNLVGTEISKITELGGHSAIGFKKINVSWDYLQSPLTKPLLKVKNRFNELEEDRQQILDSYLGLALRYYNFALQAFSREPKMIGEMIIDLSISAEVLFSTGSYFKRNLKHRLSNYLARDESQKIIIAKNVDSFYEYRSALIHGGVKKRNVTLNELSVVKKYIQKAIDKALSQKLFTKNELIKFIE